MQLEVGEVRAETMKSQLEKKSWSSEVYLNTEVDSLLHKCYSREEVDAIMSRVWWRLGDVSKQSIPARPATSQGMTR
ncbi:unnamed protein product [Polarella glacialis]|uniref:Uncharacterized protein n=1 Tax=Polarella glacialis TaxID=89957 RepID=A0A813GIQ7_POLGL|nr:unnamed protein product [Polarella glacialis]